jgi:nitrite reductase/ring-hydroxylating ferredoxin subunit
MESLIPAGPLVARALCRLDDIPDGASQGFPGPAGSFTGIFIVRSGGILHGYVNACPHIGTPLDWVPDRFLTVDRTRIICSIHGAEFRIEDGVCLSGPCPGTALEPVLIQVNDGIVCVMEPAIR